MPSMQTTLIGTVIFAALIVAGGLWVLLWAVRILEDCRDADTDVVRPDEAPSVDVASDGERRDARPVLPVSSEEYRRELKRRLDASHAHPRGPARLSGRRVSKSTDAA